MMKKKDLDPKWVSELVTYMLGPQITIMTMHSPATAEEFTKIVHGAIRALYENGEFKDTNEWVVVASNRAWELYNTFMTAKLMKLFDDGVPGKPKIVLVKGNGAIN